MHGTPLLLCQRSPLWDLTQCEYFSIPSHSLIADKVGTFLMWGFYSIVKEGGGFYAKLQIPSGGHYYTIQQLTDKKKPLCWCSCISSEFLHFTRWTEAGKTKRQHCLFLYSLVYDNILKSYDCLHCYVYMPEQIEKYVDEKKKPIYCLQFWYPNYHK
jgi:hypothetical protein